MTCDTCGTAPKPLPGQPHATGCTQPASSSPGLFHGALACRAQLVSGKQERIQSVFPKKETFGFGHSFQVWTSSFTLIPKARGIPVSPSSSFHPAQHQVTHREDTHNYPQNLNVLFHFFLKHFCTEKQILIR